jgi:hypothetical protein
MKEEEFGNMIDIWLKENGNPQIEIKVLYEVIDLLLQKQDEFAIDFTKWCFKKYNIISCYDMEKILEIYKKER